MTISGTLYTPKCYHKACRAQLAAAYSKASVTVVDYCPGLSDVSSKAIKKCPEGVAPLFEAADGTVLFDANAIAFFLGNKQLRGGENEHFVTQWVNFVDNILLPSVAAWLYPILGATPYNKQQVSKGHENVSKALAFLNNYMSSRTYFVGDSITQADLTMYSVVRLLFEHLFDESARQSHPHFTRWFITIANQPEVVELIGSPKLCREPAVYDPKKHPNLVPKIGNKHAKKEKPEKRAISKQGKPRGDDAEEPAPKPPKNPFAALPVGTFDYDAFKRIYSNEDIEKVAIPAFWDKFDPKTDSIWFSEYNYPDELRLTFMSANLIQGMFQRLEGMQKYTFAVMNVFGEDGKNTISGVWVWRGTQLAFLLSEDLQVDYDCYTWTQLDPEDPKTKLLVKEYFCHEATFNGMKIADHAVFK